jgi:hypothetical protein
LNKLANRLTIQPTGQPLYKLTNKPNNQTTSQVEPTITQKSISHPLHKLANGLTIQPTGQPLYKLTSKPNNQPATDITKNNHQVEQSVNKTIVMQTSR